MNLKEFKKYLHKGRVVDSSFITGAGELDVITRAVDVVRKTYVVFSDGSRLDLNRASDFVFYDDAVHLLSFDGVPMVVYYIK